MKPTTTGSPGQGGKKRGQRSRLEQTTGRLGPAMNGHMAELLRHGIDRYYHCIPGVSSPQAYIQTLREFFTIGGEIKHGIWVPVLAPAHEMPSFWQFRHIYRKSSRLG